MIHTQRECWQGQGVPGPWSWAHHQRRPGRGQGCSCPGALRTTPGGPGGTHPTVPGSSSQRGEVGSSWVTLWTTRWPHSTPAKKGHEKTNNGSHQKLLFKVLWLFSHFLFQCAENVFKLPLPKLQSVFRLGKITLPINSKKNLDIQNTNIKTIKRFHAQSQTKMIHTAFINDLYDNEKHYLNLTWPNKNNKYIKHKSGILL